MCPEGPFLGLWIFNLCAQFCSICPRVMWSKHRKLISWILIHRECGCKNPVKTLWNAFAPCHFYYLYIPFFPGRKWDQISALLNMFSVFVAFNKYDSLLGYYMVAYSVHTVQQRGCAVRRRNSNEVVQKQENIFSGEGHLYID